MFFTPHGLDMVAAMQMIPIVERGRAALEARILLLPFHDRPVTPVTIDVVTEADYAAHAVTCLRHAVHNIRTVHVLCEDGSVCALLMRVPGKRP